MHVLDDLDGLSPSARAFLTRTARREPADTGLGTGARDPLELSVRRRNFVTRFGGLRYTVRRSARVGHDRWDIAREWRFDLDGWTRRERDGWTFGWIGEGVSSPVRHVLHTDGRFGVTDGGAFLEACPSICHLIEGHALMDEVADWHPVGGSALETWAGGRLDAQAGDLSVVSEASGPYDCWLRSDDVVVRRFKLWTNRRDRPTRVMASTRQQVEWNRPPTG
ncbi:hypothetical protein Aab01nite_76960 [Paractinoplanes abujensis]|uniref:Uncharacterized protein n=1 Tax=Paractinoplanes abujensis TaxID=882441 RepID=A0A7W7CPM4_9ACTN|nr:hypothetical protein [Actinoplanes abujensis]MBB4692417.1 hypothetical protein [Actinoplanes abujensis]GID24106.1 hypothetical protein Aab01nite_76960 [Actinoplanes abujensis]